MSDIRIRALEPEDLPALTEAWNQPRFIWGTLQQPHASLDARKKRQANAAASTVHLVAEIDGLAVGSAALILSENRRRAHTASLGMGVHDAYAGRGAGRALLAALIDQADNWLNLRRIELTVWTDNHRAVALYERMGFEREGTLRDYAFREGAYVDAYTMARLKH